MNIVVAIVGTLIGIIIGALPGLGASVAMTLALPITFSMGADSAIILLMALYCGATYGGSISAILINTPGTPASGATTFDGYPMARRGQGDRALGLSAMASFIGGEIGAVLLITIAPLVTKLVLKFGPSEMFLLAVFSLTIVGALGGKELLKGLISCGVGLMISFIGSDIITGYRRFTFGSRFLVDGISTTVAMIGLFAVAEMLNLLNQKNESVSEINSAGKIKNVINGCVEACRHPKNLIRSSLIGSVIGAIPALGVTTASFMSYMMAKSGSKHPETFGEGDPDGIIAPETANNAVTATALIPTLTLGIPGSSTMAIILGALTVQGIVPGSDIFIVNPEKIYAVLFAIFFINVYMLAIGVFGGGVISRITIIPNSVLAPIVIVLCVVGAFAIGNNWQDILVAIIFGFIGYFMKKHNYSILGLILGMILGPIAETAFYQASIIAKGNYLAAFTGNPIRNILIVCIVASILYPIIKSACKKRKKEK